MAWLFGPVVWGSWSAYVLLSIIETSKKQGLNILETIQAALNQSLLFEGGALDSYKLFHLIEKARLI